MGQEHAVNITRAHNSMHTWWVFPLRTEAQMRASLHAHILCWFKKRKKSDDFKPIPVIERTAPGVEPRQRPLGQTVAPLKEHQEDNIYQHAHVGPITAEMVRPNVSGSDWGGYTVEKLRIAGLARAIQQRLPYLHRCSSLYCLKNRSTCRFFYPWPYQPHQCFDCNTERVALRRLLPEDDQFVVPHNLYLTMYSPSSINVAAFDPYHGADQARAYAAKYASKPEKWFYLETESNSVKDWLKCRTVGLLSKRAPPPPPPHFQRRVC